MNFAQIGFGFFSIETFGLFFTFAFLFVSWHFYKKLQAEQFSVDFFLHHFWRWVLGGIVIGRLVSVLTDPHMLFDYGILGFFAFWENGVSLWGMALGTLWTMFFDMKRGKENFFAWTDLGVGSLMLGILIVDLAAFFTGEIYGSSTALPWGVQYETFGVPILLPVHPLMLYAFLAHFLLLYFIQRKREFLRKKYVGYLSVFMAKGLFLIDFFLQFLRGDPSFLQLGFIRVEQIIDLLMIGLLFYFSEVYLKKKNV